ncbi:hypothetical protein ACI2JN_01735 [Ochrobactrum teleogrylli]|uniref:hypothetical protein n=1 Tax=Ochrobactrum teleogrylli TaxID=2479765 RepID=UPI00384E94BA
MEKWKSWAIGVGAGWVLLAFIAWQFESTCGVFLSGACLSTYWDVLRSIVLMKWVKEFQTLVGGILALGAGTFVLLAASVTARSTERETNKQQVKFSIIACSIIADEFEELSRELKKVRSYLYGPLDVSNHLKTLPHYLPQIHYISPTLGTMISYTRREAELSAADLQYDVTERLLVVANLLLAATALREIRSNLSEKGTFEPDAAKRFSGDIIAKTIRRLGVPPKALSPWESLFDWSK